MCTHLKHMGPWFLILSRGLDTEPTTIRLVTKERKEKIAARTQIWTRNFSILSPAP